MAEENLKHKTKVGLYWKFLEQFANYGMQFVIGIFMARLLSPEDYGISALPGVFLAVAGIFANAGFGTALMRKENVTEEDLSTAFYYSTGMGILLYIALFFASPYIADFYHVPILTPLIRVTSLGFIYGPLGTPQYIILTRRLDFKTPTKVSVVCKVLGGAIGISMAYYGYGVWSLAISSMVAGIIGLLINWYIVRWYPKRGWSKESFKYLWGFGNKFILSQLLDTIYNNITPIAIGKFYSTKELGVYNRAESYAKLPSQNITGVIEGVTFPVLSKMQGNDERLKANYLRMIKATAFIVFPLMMGLAALANPLVILMVTAKWQACVIYLQILCFSLMWFPIHSLNLNLLLVKGRSDLFLRLEIAKKIMGLSVLSITLPMGILFFCIGRIISSLLCLIINTYYNGKLLDMGFLRQMKDLAPTFTLSLLMFMLCYGITIMFESYWLQLIVGFVIGGTFYLGCAYTFKICGLEDAIYMIKRKK